MPIVRAARARRRATATTSSPPSGGAATHDGRPVDELQVRNDTVAMFAVTTETTINVLTWLWPHLERAPEVAERLTRRLTRWWRRHGRPRSTCRAALHPDGARRADPALPGRAGCCPRQRDRRGPPRRGASRGRGDGAGQPARSPSGCRASGSARGLRPRPVHPGAGPRRGTGTRTSPSVAGRTSASGTHLFYLEAQLIVATLLSRYRFRVRSPDVPAPLLAAALRPRDRVRADCSPPTGGRRLSVHPHRGGAARPDVHGRRTGPDLRARRAGTAGPATARRRATPSSSPAALRRARCSATSRWPSRSARPGAPPRSCG